VTSLAAPLVENIIMHGHFSQFVHTIIVSQATFLPVQWKLEKVAIAMHYNLRPPDVAPVFFPL